MLKFLRHLILGIGSALLILALFLIVEHYRGKAALSAYRQKLRVQKERLTLTELNIPPVPRPGNGAEALLKAARELENLKAKCPLASGLVSSRKQIAPGRALVSWNQPRPQPSFVAKNDPRPGTETWDDLARQIRLADPLLDQIRAALSQPVVAVDLKYGDGLKMDTSHLNRMRIVARWLSSSATYHFHNRQPDRALEDLITLARLTHSLDSDWSVTSQLTGSAIGDTGLAGIWTGLQSSDWKEPQLAQLQQAWQNRKFLNGMERGLEIDRVILSSGAFGKLRDSRQGRKILEEGLELFSSDQLPKSSPWTRLQKRITILIWPFAWSDQDELRFLERTQSDIEQTRLLMKSRSWQEVRPLLIRNDKERRNLGLYDRSRFWLSSLMAQGTQGRSVLARLRFEVDRQLAVTAIALKRYQLRYRKPAPNLAALVPSFLPQLPVDYMDGKILRYRLNLNETFILYSVGEDGRDDGGNPAPFVDPKTKILGYGRDIIWPLQATREEIKAFETVSSKQ